MVIEAIGELALAEDVAAAPVTLSPSSIASAAALGTPYATEGIIAVPGMASVYALGTPAIVHIVTGIASAQAFGTPSLGEYRVYLPLSRI
jgi:hypothetical protein